MDVGRPVEVAAGGGQQAADRAVGRDRVGAGGHRPEPEATLVVAGEQAPAIARRLPARLLDVVEAVVVGLPDVDLGARQRGAAEGDDPAGDHAGLAGADQVDGVAQLAGGEATMWKGPSTVDSVASLALRWLMASTSMVTPSTSDSRMNSWRWSSQRWPVAVRNPTARSHSSKVGSTSRTNPCRCRTRLPRISRAAGRRSRRSWPPPRRSRSPR